MCIRQLIPNSKYERDVLSNRTIKGIAVNGICVFLLCSRKRRTG